jgi:hypothetical protein
VSARNTPASTLASAAREEISRGAGSDTGTEDIDADVTSVAWVNPE